MFVALCLADSSARADPASAQAAADELFDRAKSLLQAGDWDGACQRFQASMDLDASVSTLLKIAKCREHEGKLTEALVDYRNALALNRDKAYPTPSRRQELDAYTNAALEKLIARMPRLRVIVRDPPRDLHLTANDDVLPPGSLGEDLFENPGPMVVVAEAPGCASVRREVTLTEATLTDVEIELHVVTAAPVSPAPRIVVPAQSKSVDRRTPVKTAAIVTGGIGVVGLVVGAGLGIATLVKVGDARAFCDTSWVCGQPGLDALATARGYQTAGIVVSVASALALGAGITLWLTAPRAEPRPVGIALGPGSIVARGSF